MSSGQVSPRFKKILGPEDVGRLVSGILGPQDEDKIRPTEVQDADLVDLVGLLEGGLEGPQPTILRVQGGEALFYPQSLNGLMGEPESGKSWLALTAVAQVAVDSKALIIDLEDSPQTTARRLRQLGLDAADMRRVQYSRPHDAAELTARLVKAAAAPPALVVIDAMGELMVMLEAGILRQRFGDPRRPEVPAAPGTCRGLRRRPRPRRQVQ